MTALWMALSTSVVDDPASMIGVIITMALDMIAQVGQGCPGGGFHSCPGCQG